MNKIMILFFAVSVAISCVIDSSAMSAPAVGNSMSTKASLQNRHRRHRRHHRRHHGILSTTGHGTKKVLRKTGHGTKKVLHKTGEIVH